MSAEQQPACVNLRARKTRFIEILRTTPPRTVCPNFYLLAHANGCAFQPRCDYCYLKSSLWHVPVDAAFENIERMLVDVRRWLARDDLETYVLNAGNLSDSLAFEEVRPMARALIEEFRDACAAGRKHTLLLVTKGGMRECRTLLDMEPCPSVIVSFSVNAPAVADAYERGAAPVADRMDAARRLMAAGWRVRIRIDPMFAGHDYGGIVADVRALAPERVTLGSLRAEPHLLRVADDGIFDALERSPEPKGLARYPLPARLAMYRAAVDGLGGTCPVGLCEETRDVWDALGLDAEAMCCNCGD
jgi:spore photoproduct lyase